MYVPNEKRCFRRIFSLGYNAAMLLTTYTTILLAQQFTPSNWAKIILPLLIKTFRMKRKKNGRAGD
jgi:hypothetical protein